MHNFVVFWSAMFPSSGYFRGVRCPYFSSGLCDRPYCHFGHVRAPTVPNTSIAGQFCLHVDGKQGFCALFSVRSGDFLTPFDRWRQKPINWNNYKFVILL